MIKCPSCGEAYRILTSRPISSELREICCHCKHCNVTFRQYSAFEGFIVENKKSTPPDATRQPALASHRQKLLDILNPKNIDDKKEPIGMVFKRTYQP